MADLIIYDSSRAESKLTALEAMVKLPGATVKDFKGLALSAINTYIGLLSAGAYSKIIVCVNNTRVEGGSPVGVAGDISQAYFGDLEAKMASAPVRDSTAQAGAVGTITLDSGASATDDYYNGMQIWIHTGTGADQVRVITDYVGSTKVATVDYSWGTNPANDSQFIITQDLLEFGRSVASKKPPLRLWETLMSSYPNDIPTLISLTGGLLETHVYAKDAKTATNIAAGTLTHSSQFVDGAYNKATNSPAYYIAIKLSSTSRAAGQVKEITSNTVNVITLTDLWDITPDSNCIYQIGREKNMLWDLFLPLAIETELGFNGDTFPGGVVGKFKKLVDRYDGIASGKSKLFEDSDYLEELAAIGEVIFRAKTEGAVS